MKKIILVLLMCGMLFTLLTACSTASEPTDSPSSTSYAPIDPYRVLDFPEDIKFGMHIDEVGEITGAVRTVASSTLAHNLKIYLNYYCMVSEVTYFFSFEDVDEFEDGSILSVIKFEITDIIPDSRRTKERHGDIDAEYDTVYARLEEKYGEPDIKIEDGQEYKKLRRSVWENEEGMGIILNLSQRTSALDKGTVFLTYLDPSIYKKSWVDDFGW